MYHKDRLVGMQAWWGREKREQRFLYVDEIWSAETKETLTMMVRITDLMALLPVFSLWEEGEQIICLQVEDPLIPGNCGTFLWTLTKDGSTLARIGDLGEEMTAPCLKTGIGDLTSWLFGWGEAPCLWSHMDSHLMKELEKIKRVQGVFLDEVV